MDRKYEGKLSAIVTKVTFPQGTTYNIFKFDHRGATSIDKKLDEYYQQQHVEVAGVYKGINEIASRVLALAIDSANEGEEVDFQSILN